MKKQLKHRPLCQFCRRSFIPLSCYQAVSRRPGWVDGHPIPSRVHVALPSLPPSLPAGVCSRHVSGHLQRLLRCISGERIRSLQVSHHTTAQHSTIVPGWMDGYPPDMSVGSCAVCGQVCVLRVGGRLRQEDVLCRVRSTEEPVSHTGREGGRGHPFIHPHTWLDILRRVCVCACVRQVWPPA